MRSRFSVRTRLAGWLAALLLLPAPLPGRAQEVVRFMPQWTPQAQFAGYYVALEKGFFDAEGLTVVLDHFGGNSSETAIGRLASGEVDIVTSQLIAAMVGRERGIPMVNVLQTAQVSGLMCAAHFPIGNPQALDGRKVGRWKVGFGEICDIFCHRNGLSLNWIPYIHGINLYVSGAVDALLCYSYNEFIQLELATGGIPPQNIIRFADEGIDYPEDGLYVTERYYRLHRETVDKFVRASRRGWDYVRAHPDEALEITMDFIRKFNVVTNRTVQRRMLEEILRLQVNPATGIADYAPVEAARFDELARLLRETGCLEKIPVYKEMIR